MVQLAANDNMIDSDGESPLWKARQNRHVGVVKELLQWPDVNTCSNYGVSSLPKCS